MPYVASTTKPSSPSPRYTAALSPSGAAASSQIRTSTRFRSRLSLSDFAARASAACGRSRRALLGEGQLGQARRGGRGERVGDLHLLGAKVAPPRRRAPARAGRRRRCASAASRRAAVASPPAPPRRRLLRVEHRDGARARSARGAPGRMRPQRLARDVRRAGSRPAATRASLAAATASSTTGGDPEERARLVARRSRTMPGRLLVGRYASSRRATACTAWPGRRRPLRGVPGRRVRMPHVGYRRPSSCIRRHRARRDHPTSAIRGTTWSHA